MTAFTLTRLTTKMEDFDAGFRLRQVFEYLKAEKKVNTQEEFGALFGRDQSGVSRYFKTKLFSALILGKLTRLKEFGINLDYLAQKDAPMLLKNVVTIDGLQDTIKKLQERIEELEKGEDKD